MVEWKNSKLFTSRKPKKDDGGHVLSARRGVLLFSGVKERIATGLARMVPHLNEEHAKTKRSRRKTQETGKEGGEYHYHKRYLRVCHCVVRTDMKNEKRSRKIGFSEFRCTVDLPL